MRIGQNPAKSIDHVPQPARVTVAVVVYIPFLHGYYAQSLDVLKTCLSSLWENTPQPYDLLVFDNASCSEVRSYLQDAQQSGQIQYLLLSDRNVGKGGAWNMIFQGAPGEIIAYADSDVYFYPGWLESTLKLLEVFPNVGMVTSRPLRTPEKYATSTLEWARRTPGVELEQGQFMSWEIYQEHTDSLGVAVTQAREWYESTYDWRIHFGAVSAYAGAAHFQFVAYKTVLQSVTPFSMDRPMGQVRTLDEKLNEQGCLRLGTVERLVRHLGNTIDYARSGAAVGDKRSSGQASPDAPGYNRRSDPTSFDSTVKRAPRKRLRDFPPIRRSLLWLYDRIFRLYYAQK